MALARKKVSPLWVSGWLCQQLVSTHLCSFVSRCLWGGEEQAQPLGVHDSPHGYMC